MIKTMLKGNAGSLINKTYEVTFPSRLHIINCHTLLYDFAFIYIDYIHCYMIFFIYTLITYIGKYLPYCNILYSVCIYYRQLLLISFMTQHLFCRHRSKGLVLGPSGDNR